MRHGLFIAPFGELADPLVLAELAASAEARGFDGIFLWDHVDRPHHDELAVPDSWIALAAIATRTTRLRLGPMVTPLSRRRPQHVARQATTLDHLSRGRLVLGVGLGVDTGGELTKFGEVLDERTRAEMLDESLDLIDKLWSGERITHQGKHYQADDVRFRPRPLQEPRVPIWVAARSVRPGPLRRAARLDGLFPLTSPEGLTEMLGEIERVRGSLDRYEVACTGEPEEDPTPFQRAGATWWLTALPEIETADHAAAVIDDGPRTRG